MKKLFTHMPIPIKSIGVLPLLGGTCLVLFASFLIHAPARAVSGTVKNESGEPVLVAEVLVKSTSNGFACHADGKTLHVPY